MAIGGKSLGIVSGLAVGLTSGVILAALNPIVPQKGASVSIAAVDEIALAPEPETKSDPSLPKLSMVDTTPEASTESESSVEPEAVVAITEPSGEVNEPTIEPEVTSEPPQTIELETLEPVGEPETQLALVLPENTQQNDLSSAPQQLISAQNDTQPNVSSEPAQAIDLAEPNLETDSPIVTVAEPVTSDAVEIASVSEPEPTAEPSAIIPNDTVVASLPKIQDPIAPKRAVAIVEETEPEEQPNTSGTFKTSGGSIITKGSNLPKIGGTQESNLASLGSGNKTSRFKTIGDSTKILGDDDTQTESQDPDVGALVRNANKFPVSDAPLLSIILIDNGQIENQLSSLQGLNLPLTMAISLDEPDAAERAKKYTDAGFEVLAMTPRNVKLSLSGGQSNEQVAKLLTEYFNIMPTSVGLIDRPSANLQKDQRLSRSVVKHFAKTGHGLITYGGGLNGTKRAADQENVASGTVFRFLDKSGEAEQIITQQLDRAAREARSKGAAIVMATPSKATLSTLVGWSLSSKARAVTLAPVSASLLKN